MSSLFLFLIRNFEESEDELREAVADSMKKLFVSSSEEAENREEGVAVEQSEEGGAVSSVYPQQIQPEVDDVTAVPAGVISSEPEERDSQSETQVDDNKALNKQTTWLLTNIQSFILSELDNKTAVNGMFLHSLFNFINQICIEHLKQKKDVDRTAFIQMKKLKLSSQ